MYLVVDSVADVLKFKAMENLTRGIILGMDFIEKWDIESRRIVNGIHLITSKIQKLKYMQNVQGSVN